MRRIFEKEYPQKPQPVDIERLIYRYVHYWDSCSGPRTTLLFKHTKIFSRNHGQFDRDTYSSVAPYLASTEPSTKMVRLWGVPLVKKYCTILAIDWETSKRLTGVLQFLRQTKWKHNCPLSSEKKSQEDQKSNHQLTENKRRLEHVILLFPK